MYATLKEAFEALWMPLCLSMMGFLVRVARFGVTSWRAFASALVCSAFVGILSHWFLAGTGMDVQLASAVIAMSGYCGGALLDAMHGRIIKEVSEAPLPESRPWDGVERRRALVQRRESDYSGALESGDFGEAGFAGEHRDSGQADALDASHGASGERRAYGERLGNPNDRGNG